MLALSTISSSLLFQILTVIAPKLENSQSDRHNSKALGRSTPVTRCALCSRRSLQCLRRRESKLSRARGFAADAGVRRTTSPFQSTRRRLCRQVRGPSRSPGQTPAPRPANAFAGRSSLALSGRQHQVRFRSSCFGPETDLKLDTRAGWPVARDWVCLLSLARAARALPGA